jgi:hypothetical protein
MFQRILVMLLLAACLSIPGVVKAFNLLHKGSAIVVILACAAGAAGLIVYAVVTADD